MIRRTITHRLFTSSPLSRAAFTLVELSVVLVIIGLLAGTIMVGKSLVRSAELRSVGAEFQQFNTAISAFREKYGALPGDMDNATTYWAGTFNGNANGWYDVCDSPPERESLQGYKQLVLAGFLEGNYAGTGTTSTANACHTTAVPTVNVPGGKVTNSTWMMLALSQRSSTNNEMGYTDLPDIRYNWMIYGAYWPSGLPVIGILKPAEAWNIDSKLDDGWPGMGFVRAGYGGGGSSTTCQSGTTSTSTYNTRLTSTASLCYLGFQF